MDLDIVIVELEKAVEIMREKYAKQSTLSAAEVENYENAYNKLWQARNARGRV